MRNAKPTVDRQKGVFLTSLRTGKNQLAPMWQGNFPRTTFEKFRESWLWPEDGTGGIIKQFCKRAFPGHRGVAIVTKIQSEDPALLRLNRFRLFIEAQIALPYQDLVKGGTPSRGDGGDLRHSAHIGSCNVFVTNDRRLTEILAHLQPPRPEVVDFQTFLSRCLPVAPLTTKTVRAPLGTGVAT